MDRAIKKKTFTVKRVLTASAALIFISLVFYGFFFGDRSSKLNVQRERLTISTVIKDLYQEYIPVMGNVIPIKTYYLDAVQGGMVVERFLEAGVMVEKGDRILQFENSNLLLNVMQGDARFFEQRNNLRNTQLSMEERKLALLGELERINYQIRVRKISFDRAKKMKEKNLISDLEYETEKYEYEYLVRNKDLTIRSFKQDSVFREVQVSQLQGSLERLEENLLLSKKQLENLIVKAPVSGYLTALDAEIGESKATGQRLGQIDILDGFKIRVPIDEHYRPQVLEKLNGECDYAGKKFKLIVDKVFPEIVNGRFNIDMLFTDDVPDGITRGLTLHIKLDLGGLSEAILLPKGGFYQKTGGNWVYIVDPSGDFAVKRRIRPGRYNPQYYEILEGLEPGEKVITSNYDNYGDVDKLIIKD